MEKTRGGKQEQERRNKRTGQGKLKRKLKFLEGTLNKEKKDQD